MGKLFFWICIGLCLFYLYTSGVLIAVLNGNTPQVGRLCEAVGPKEGRIYFSSNKAEMRWPIDAKIGFSSRDRRPSEARLNDAIDCGRIMCPGDKTSIKVLANGYIEVYTCRYRVCKVEILNGIYRGRKGWMLREDVIDTPLQQCLQANFRSGARSFNEELGRAQAKASTMYDFD